MYPPTSYYGAHSQQQNCPTIPALAAPVPNKATVTNTHSGDYYHNHQQQQHHLPQHHVAPSPYNAPQPYATTPATLPSSATPPTNTQYNQQPLQQQQQQQLPYGTPGTYYGQMLNAPPVQPPQQQPTSVPVSRAPLYPNVSYASVTGSSQYGTMGSSQTTSSHAAVPTSMGAPLHQYSNPSSTSTTAEQPGYSMGPPSQLAAVNGQGSTGGLLWLMWEICFGRKVSNFQMFGWGDLGISTL